MKPRFGENWVKFTAKPVRKGNEFVILFPKEIVKRCDLSVNDLMSISYDSPKKCFYITKLS